MRDERSPEERQRELEELAAELTLQPDSRVFARLAEAYRGAGMPAEARRVALQGLERHPGDLPGRLALGLALLDLDRGDEAREVLHELLASLESLGPEGAVAAAPAFAEPSTAPSAEEIDSAFESAEAEREHMRDAVTVAHEAMRAENLDEPELGGRAEVSAEVSLEDDDEEPEAAEAFWEAHPTFATATMAGLLEGQGHGERARAIRERLGTEPPGEPAPLDAAMVPEEVSASAPAGPDRRGRVLATLELWLRNIRREVR